MIKNILFISFLTLFLVGCSPFDDDEDQVVVQQVTNSSQNECNTQIINTSHPKKRPMLVVLLSYNNIQIDSSISTWNSKIFGNSEHQLNHYYNEISHSQFAFTQATECHGVAWVKLNKNHPNTDIDSPSFNTMVHPDLKMALESLDEKISFDIYDTDNNGHITPNELLITYIIAGYEDAYEGNHVNQGIWAHQSCLGPSYTPTLDGVSIMGCENEGNFALFGEKHDKARPHDATIGIIAHELGHSAFNLPDLYNTKNPSSGGVGYFGLMGAGTWTQKNIHEFPGDTPVHMSAWSKLQTGWITPDLATTSEVTLNATSLNSYNSLKIPINNDEYYLLENRDNSGYDRGFFMLDGTFKGGVAIWHVNNTQLTQAKITANEVNINNYNKGLDLIEASFNNIDSGGDGHAKNLFYDGHINNFSNAGISNISAPGTTMTLDLNKD